MNKEEYKKRNCLPMYYLEQRDKQLELADEMVNQIYWYDGVVNKLADENKNLKQALNEIREKLKLKIKENQELIEKLADTGSFRIGNAQSKIKDYQEFLQIIDKYKKEG